MGEERLAEVKRIQKASSEIILIGEKIKNCRRETNFDGARKG